MAPQQQKSVLITGCSEGGIGFALAKEFQARGLHVFATARSLSKMGPLKDLPNVTLLPLDVTSPESVSSAVATVSQETGGKLEVLVNNSGVTYFMPLIDADVQYAKDMFDVNVWGIVAVTKAFAPLVIAGKGSIVNLSSLAAMISQPYMGLYTASKAAVEAISESLRLEMKPFGVKVVTVMTGVSYSNAFKSTLPLLPKGSLYEKARKEIEDRQTGRNAEGKLGQADEFARKLAGDVLGGASGRVYRGKFSSTMKFMTTYLPFSVQDSMSTADSGLHHVAQ